MPSTSNPSRRDRARSWVTQETTGGFLLIGAAVIALIWANSPVRESYFSLTELVVGPSAIHLDLSLGTWAADGLLAIFFFVVGVELKHEFVAGSLRDVKQAGVPMLAAVGGMAVPAAIYAAVVVLAGDPGALSGWAIPAATDIAFALAVLAVFGRGLPSALRTFLLTLAVVDDLLAIIVIAVFYTDELHLQYLAVALAAVAAFAVLVRLKKMRWYLLLPLALVAWAFMHEAGIHATIAGVLLGLTVPAIIRHGEAHTRTHELEHHIKPISAGIALPVFAFFSAGVSVVDGGGIGTILGQPVVLAIVLGLIAGKVVGVLGVTWVVIKITPLRLPDRIGVRDLLPVGLLAGIGFTVALLIAELSFTDAEHTSGAKAAILAASLLAAVLAAITLRWDAGEKRSRDMNEDGVLDSEGTDIGDPDEETGLIDPDPGPIPTEGRRPDATD
ncbi:Na+/H+ antiporter NhaA [Ruania alba]|uniref:Na(+)/H(+) antiporter NhaA n=1 Tax=Ruania alba TaxID=648782 RepID=A0A1H5L8C1_9MICO|nr:Na+/H+ antiporter NhaA [Ruania alba]SEE73230.1 sodium/proton antiporter, NhaA family [Ruania alba]